MYTKTQDKKQDNYTQQRINNRPAISKLEPCQHDFENNHKNQNNQNQRPGQRKKDGFYPAKTEPHKCTAGIHFKNNKKYKTQKINYADKKQNHEKYKRDDTQNIMNFRFHFNLIMLDFVQNLFF